jgi:hypothetical protein
MLEHLAPAVAADTRQPEFSMRRLLAAVAAIVVLVCVGGGVWWQSRQVEVAVYRDARVMAEVIGCQDTYVEVVSPAATTAGRCLVDGVAVELRTLPDQRSAEAWHGGMAFAAPQPPFAGIGEDYVFLCDDQATFAAVSEALG